jgi:hypothetical protein
MKASSRIRFLILATVAGMLVAVAGCNGTIESGETRWNNNGIQEPASSQPAQEIEE